MNLLVEKVDKSLGVTFKPKIYSKSFLKDWPNHSYMNSKERSNISKIHKDFTFTPKISEKSN